LALHRRQQSEWIALDTQRTKWKTEYQASKRKSESMDNSQFNNDQLKLNVIHDINLTRTPHVEIVLNGTIKTTALIDTGAVFYILDETLAQQLPNLLIRDTKVTAIAANNQQIHFIGSTVVDIQFGDIEESIYVQIQDMCSAQVILGTNFLSRFSRLEVNFEKSFIRLKN